MHMMCTAARCLQTEKYSSIAVRFSLVIGLNRFPVRFARPFFHQSKIFYTIGRSRKTLIHQCRCSYTSRSNASACIYRHTRIVDGRRGVWRDNYYFYFPREPKTSVVLGKPHGSRARPQSYELVSVRHCTTNGTSTCRVF